MQKRVALIIMDGWGKGKKDKTNAIAQANVEFVNSLYSTYPNAELFTHGEYVGLPFGQMGNSEVGHLNLGGGRVVYQELLLINKAIESGNFEKNTELNNLFSYCLENQKPLHLIGLVSDGGVHAHLEHLIKICEIADANGLKEIYIHAFTDGRDTDPKAGLHYLNYLQEKIRHTNAKIASVCGRYYAMDRDKRWERVKLAYDLLVKGKGENTDDIFQAIENSYNQNITDEFIKPIISTKNFKTIKNNDAVFCFNFRTDRCREITEVLTQRNAPEFEMEKLSLYYVTMTVYDSNFKQIRTIFSNEKLKNTLGEVLSVNRKTQLRAAETEKYPHVTFFFSGGKEELFEGETRILEPSPKVATYDLQPEMSANPLAEKVNHFIEENKPDFVCLNFANADMVGHTGVFQAVIKAVGTVSNCVEKVVETCLQSGYTILLTADHGNADCMLNDDGSPNTAHSKNVVPVFLISKNELIKIKNGKLADIAPTVLDLMHIEKPMEMDGESLLIK